MEHTNTRGIRQEIIAARSRIGANISLAELIGAKGEQVSDAAVMSRIELAAVSGGVDWSPLLLDVIAHGHPTDADRARLVNAAERFARRKHGRNMDMVLNLRRTLAIIRRRIFLHAPARLIGRTVSIPAIPMAMRSLVRNAMRDCAITPGDNAIVERAAGECERLIAAIDDDVRAGRARYDATLPLYVAIG